MFLLSDTEAIVLAITPMPTLSPTNSEVQVHWILSIFLWLLFHSVRRPRQL